MTHNNQGDQPRYIFLWFGALGLYWLTLWNALRIDWETNDQYGYGWGVPFIAVCFFALRWSRRPAARPPAPMARRLICAVLVLAAALQIPFRLILGANAEWRMIFWGMELQCVFLTLGVLALTGGPGWVRHFFFPVFFTATAVPWPQVYEEQIIQTLARAVARVTIEGLFWIGIPAHRLGNLIQLPSGTIGLSEACSGIRSLQTSLMLALVAGEIWSLTTKRRGFLLLLAGAAAFLLNSSRSFFLSLLTHRGGPDAFERWHDSAGTLEISCCFIVVIFLGWSLRPRLARVRAGTPARAGIAAEPGTAGRILPLHAGMLSFLVAAWFLAETGAAFWFYDTTGAMSAGPGWAIVAPEPVPDGFLDFKKLTLPARERAQLQTNDGVSFSWKQAGELSWHLTFLRWPAGRTSLAAVMLHHPDVCLPAHGYQFDMQKPSLEITVNGIPMFFHHYLFEQSSQPVHVFYLMTDLNTSGVSSFESDLSASSRLRSALAGRRNASRALLELILTGAKSDEAACRSLPLALEPLAFSAGGPKRLVQDRKRKEPAAPAGLSGSTPGSLH